MNLLQELQKMLKESDDYKPSKPSKPIESKQTKDKVDDKTFNNFKSFQQDSDKQVGSAATSDIVGNKTGTKLKSASAEKTRELTSKIKMDDKSLGFFLSMNFDDFDKDDISNKDLVLDITKPKPTMLPAVISTALSIVGGKEPDWHQVKNLPGYMSNSIRAIGRAVFAPFTSTKIEDIQIIANLNNSGPNSQSDLNTIAEFLHKNGTRNPTQEIEFSDKIPGYKADVKLYTFANFTFLAVKDHAGNYIYAWPSTDNKKQLVDKSIDIKKSLTDKSMKQIGVK